MPLFEYRCPDCRQDFEVLVRGDEAVECPGCRSRSVEKLFSAPAAPVAAASRLPMMSSCPPSDAPPCSPHCCRLPS